MTATLQPGETFDAQVHIWADAPPEAPWPAEWRARAHRFPALGAEELLALMDREGVDRAVLVQPSWAGDSNDVVRDAAHTYPERFVVMARLGRGEIENESVLDELAVDPAVAGVRLTFHRPEMQRWLVDGTTDRLWPAVAERGLAAMVYAPYRTSVLGRIARRHPTLRLAVDALGLTLTERDADIDAPIQDLARLVDVQNIALKATALPAYVSDPYPFASLAPRLRWLFDRFGSDRIFWASDLTRVPHPYRSIVSFAGELHVLDDDELRDFMGRSLTRWLLPDASPTHPMNEVGP